MTRNTPRTLITAIAAASLALSGAPALAAATAPAAAPATKADPQVEHAILYLKVLISGLQSDKVQEPVKSELVGCLYNNSLGKITTSMDQLIVDNPGKINRDNANEVLSGLVALCGHKAGAAPATTGKQPTGR